MTRGLNNRLLRETSPAFLVCVHLRCSINAFLLNVAVVIVRNVIAGIQIWQHWWVKLKPFPKSAIAILGVPSLTQTSRFDFGKNMFHRFAKIRHTQSFEL